MSKSFLKVSLKEVIQPVERLEAVIAGKTYRQIGVRLWGEGAYERESIDGSQTKYQMLSRVETDDIIVNKIWARNGSVAVVPTNLAGCYGSGEFPTFIRNHSQLEPRWFHWITKTKYFWEQCDEKSQGTSGKNRIRPEQFLRIIIPLPPLEEQRRIVARIEEIAAKIEEARGLRREAGEEAGSVLQIARRMLIGEYPSADWLPLKTYVAQIENGWSPACENRPAIHEEWGVLKLSAVSFGTYNEMENKALPPTLEPRPEYEIRSGDFLMSRANTTDLVGACVLVGKTRSHLMLSDKIFRFLFKEKPILEHHYLEHVLKSPALRTQIEKGATGTSQSMKNISKEKVLDLLIPPCDETVQGLIVTYLDNLQSKVDTLKRMQTETSAELDVLLPSILDKAFKGEL